MTETLLEIISMDAGDCHQNRDAHGSPATTLESIEQGFNDNIHQGVVRKLSTPDASNGGDLVKDPEPRYNCSEGVGPMMPDLSDEVTRRAAGHGPSEETGHADSEGEDATLTLLRDIAKGTEDRNVDDDEVEDNKEKPQTSSKNPNSRRAAYAKTSRMPSAKNFQYSVAGRCLSTVSYNLTRSRWGRRVFKGGRTTTQGSVSVECLPNALSSTCEGERESLPADSSSYASEDDLFQGFVLAQDAETLSFDESSASCVSCDTKPSAQRTHPEPPRQADSSRVNKTNRKASQDVTAVKKHEEAKEVSEWCDQEANIHAAMKDLQHECSSPSRVEADSSSAPSQGKACYTRDTSPSYQTHHEYSMKRDFFTQLKVGIA